jgi:hypothetical protein
MPLVRAHRPVKLIVAGEFYEPGAALRARNAPLGLTDAIRG